MPEITEKVCEHNQSVRYKSTDALLFFSATNRPEGSTLTCAPGFFPCDNSCAPISKLCNGKSDCYDFEDEANCTSPANRFYQVNYVYLHKKTLNATSFLILWYSPANGDEKQEFEYMPSITLAEVDVPQWKNESWTMATEHRFSNLKPFTAYNVTVYVRPKGAQRVDPPSNFLNVTTAEGVPSEPLNVSVRQLNGSRVQVTWSPPKEAYGILKEYTVYYRAQTYNVQQPHSVKVSPDKNSIILEENFEPNNTYEYWVRAWNSKNESPNSKLVRLSLDDATDMDRLTGLHVTHMGYDYIQVAWSPIRGVEGYVVQVVLPETYPKTPIVRTNETKYRAEKLVHGVNFSIKVSGYMKNYVGRPASISSQMPGPTLPVVAVTLKRSGNTFTLQWNPVTFQGKNVTYGVYYGQTMDELLEGLYSNSNDSSIQITQPI